MEKQANYWRSRRTSALSRRRMLAGGAATAAGLAALATAGCGDDDDDAPAAAATAPASGGSSPSAAAAGQPKRGGTNIVAQTTTQTDVMDPHTSLSQAGALWSYLGNTPLRTGTDLSKLNTELVEKYELPGDGTEVLLTVRQGVKWHDKPPSAGRAFVADDLAFSLTRITGQFNPEKKAAFQRASTLPNFESATPVDEKTVRVKLTGPHSSFISGLAEWRNSVVPRDFVEKGGEFEDPASLVGTGPFVIESFNNLQKATWKANPDYWEQGKPYIDGIEWVWYGDRLSSLTSFTQGKFDYFEGPTTAERDSLKKLGSEAREESWLLGNWPHFRFHNQKDPFTDDRARRAIFLALDYKAMNDGWYGAGQWEYTGPLIPSFPEGIQSAEVAKLAGYNPSTKDADIKTAKDLMTAAGYPKGDISFKILPQSNNSSFSEYAIRAIDQLKRVWPDMKAELDIPADSAAFSRRQVAGDFDVVSYIIAPAMDPLLEVAIQYHSKGSRNYGKFSDPDMDRLLDRAVTELDTKTRAATLMEVQKSALEKHMPLIHMCIYRYATYFTKKVQGMEGYGTPLGGSSYDTKIATKGMWFA